MKKKGRAMISRAKLTEYLRRHPRTMFVRWDCERCPVGRALGMLVTNRWIRLANGPQWLRDFIRAFDGCSKGRRSGAEALAILESV